MKNCGIRNDALTLAFIAMKEGTATSAEEQMIYEACENKASYYAHNYKGVVDGDELLSSLAAKIWEKRDDFNHERAGFSTWIEQLCWSVRSSLYEKHKTNMRHGLHSLDAHLKMDENEVCYYDFIEDKKANSAEKQLILGELAADIKECLKEMSDNQRAAIEAVYIEGLKPSEAGKLLGRKMGDFYNDHNRALNNLRKKLEARGVTREEILQLID